MKGADFTSAPYNLASIAKNMLVLAGPVALTYLAAMGMGITDTILVGRHNGHHLAYLALAWSFNGTLLVMLMGFLSGTQILAARAFGAGRADIVRRIWRRGILMSLLGGGLGGLALFIMSEPIYSFFVADKDLVIGASACATYLAASLPFFGLTLASNKILDATGNQFWPLGILIVANIANLILGLWLVPSMGANGAALATCLVRAFTGFAMMIAAFYLLPKKPAEAAQSDFADDEHAEKNEQWSIGLGALISRGLEAGAFNALTIIGAAVSANVVAGFAVFLNLISTAFMPPLALASAASVMVSQATGAKEEGHIRPILGLSLGVVLTYAAIIAFVAHFFPHFFAALYTKDVAVIAASAAAIALLPLIAPFDFTQVLFADCLRALGHSWFATISHIGAYGLIMVPFAQYFCVTLNMGISGLAWAIISASIVSSLVLAARLSLSARSLKTAPAS